MVANLEHKVARIIHKHRLIIGVGTVCRVGQPKVLPHHDTVAVTCLKEFLVTGHAHPVADHVVVHLLVMAHGSIKLPTAVIQVVLAKCPITSQRHQSPVIDVNLQFGVLVNSLDLTDSRFILHGIALLPIDDKLKARIIQVRLAIAVWPPQPHPLVFKLGEFIGTKGRFNRFTSG